MASTNILGMTVFCHRDRLYNPDPGAPRKSRGIFVNADGKIYVMASNSIVPSSQDPGLIGAVRGTCARKICVMCGQPDICRLKVCCFHSVGLLGSPEVSQERDSSKG